MAQHLPDTPPCELFTFRRGKLFVLFDPDREVIQFHNVRINTSFIRSHKSERYDCPLSDVRAYEFFRGSRGEASLRFWTTQGYIGFSGFASDLRIIYNPIHAAAGDRPPPFTQSTWIAIIAIILVPLVVIICYLLLT